MGVVHRFDNGAGLRLPAEDGSVRCPALGEVVDVERCHTCPWWVRTRVDTRGDGEVICRLPEGSQVEAESTRPTGRVQADWGQPDEGPATPSSG